MMMFMNQVSFCCMNFAEEEVDLVSWLLAALLDV
jgi:hypothetical protein